MGEKDEALHYYLVNRVGLDVSFDEGLDTVDLKDIKLATSQVHYGMFVFKIIPSFIG